MKKDLEKFVKIVSKQTFNNDHNGATTTIAKYVTKKHEKLSGIEVCIKECKALELLHSFYGHMPNHLQQIREDLRASLFSFLSEDEKQAFYGAL